VSAVDVFQVTVQPSAAQITVGGTFQLSATAFDVAGHDLRRTASWASSDPGVATVSPSGLVTAAATGSATVTATVEGKKGQAVISVVPRPPASVALIPPSASLQAGDSIQLALVVKAADGTVLTGRNAVWASSDTRVALVRSDGWVVALASGTATVTAVVEGFGAQAVISVRAASVIPVANVSVAPSAATLAAGDTLRFRATLTDAQGQTLVGRVVTWTSGDPTVATVDGNGLAHALKAGSSIITAVSEGVSGVAQLTVTAPRPVAIEVTPSSATVMLGNTIQLSAVVRASDGSSLSGIPITWSSLEPAFATVNGTGLVTTVGLGIATIRAAAAGLAGTATIFVAPQPPAADVAVTKTGPAFVNTSQTFTDTVTVKNLGPNAAASVVVTDALPVNATFIGANPSATPAGGLITWSTIASLAVGDSAVFTVTMQAPPTSATVVNVAAAVTTTAESNTTNNAGSVSTTVVVPPSADLVLSFGATAGPVNVGDAITYTLQVTNAGPDAAGDVVLTQTLPANVTLVDADGGTVTSGTIDWPAVASLPSGGSFTHTVQVTANAAGSADSNASVAATTADPDGTNNAGSVSTTVN